MTRKLVPLMHPAAIDRGNWSQEPAQERYLRRLFADEWPEIDLKQPPAEAVLWPDLSSFVELKLEIKELHSPCLSIDLETAGDYIICIGMWLLDMEPFKLHGGLCARFRLQGGRRYWTKWDEHRAAVEHIYDLLSDADVAKMFHNGATFDVPMLMKHGFNVSGRIIDTMMMQRSQYSEMKAGLQYCATLYLGMPLWKTMVKEEEDEKG